MTEAGVKGIRSETDWHYHPGAERKKDKAGQPQE